MIVNTPIGSLRIFSAMTQAKDPPSSHAFPHQRSKKFSVWATEICRPRIKNLEHAASPQYRSNNFSPSPCIADRKINREVVITSGLIWMDFVMSIFWRA
jgi:hypothetical protein